MSAKHKIIQHLYSQIRVSNVTLPKIVEKTPTIIQDNNQSIHNGVINEINEPDLRGKSQPKKRGRPKKRT
jgi:hypothetical protein